MSTQMSTPMTTTTTDEGDTNTRPCFSSIQSRKFWAPLCNEVCQLCPSMDLVVLGLEQGNHSNINNNNDNSGGQAAAVSSSSSTLWIHRAISWQKLATLPFHDHPATRCVWSPDGRQLAVAVACTGANNRQQVQLFGVESLSNPPATMGAASTTPNHILELPEQQEIVGLSWAHVGQPHPTAWTLTEEEREARVSWSFQTHYVDRSCVFLPPSDYHAGVDAEGHKIISDLPTCQTPLSLLCVTTSTRLELYLYGRYHFQSLLRGTSSGASGDVVVKCSADLTNLVVYEQGSNRLSLYPVPLLAKDRYHLQMVASLHSSIYQHLHALQEAIPQVANAWKASLKPLDAKLEPLQRLLTNYGVQETIPLVFRQYILVGHSHANISNLANAMDQFFTSVQMNDQLLQRLERSLQGAVAGVETKVRQQLVAPAKALIWIVSELTSLLKYQYNDDTSVHHLEDLQQSSEWVLVSAELLLTHVLEGRFRLDDFGKWLRSTGSQIKARGTAQASAQRENAKKRRVPQVVVHRMLQYLESDNNKNTDISDGSSATTAAAAKNQLALTERLLGMTVSDLLKDTPKFVATTNSSEDRPSSPRSIAQGLELSQSTPTVAHATNETFQAAKHVFFSPQQQQKEGPRIVPRDIILPRNEAGSPLAIHTRIGRDPGEVEGFDQGEEEPSYFSPKVQDKSSLESSLDCRQWSIVAQAGSDSCIQLVAIPLGWKDPSSMDSNDILADEGKDGSEIPFYLTSKLILPESCQIQDLAFYSDNGKSALSSGTDSGTGKEGRQKLGVILITQQEQLELWLMKYDQILWQVVPFESILLDADAVDAYCHVQPLVKEDEEEQDNVQDGGILRAQTRVLSSLESGHERARLMLSGSRGIGGVTVNSQGVTSLELLDLEESEGEDEELDEEE